MRLKSQHLFAISAVVIVGLYFIVMSLFGPRDHKAANAKTPAPVQTPSVQVRLTPQTVHAHEIVLRGRTEATRAVVVKSETSGVVAETPILQGTVVRKGTVLCRLAVDARKATLDQARALLRSRQLQHQAAADLAAKGFRSQTQVLEAQANLDAAHAAVRQAEIALDQVNIRAPFTGVFDKRDAEVGAYLSPGQPCGTVIELDPLLIVGDAPETETARLQVGAPATARLVSGETISGRIRYVARDADPMTRTYHLEIVGSNPGLRVRSGLSAEVRVGAGSGPAHLVPISALVLDAAGRQGVRYVRDDNRVGFAPVMVLQQSGEGAWVSGLSGAVRVITVGQAYVAEGQKVRVAQAG
jgi:multidrug efflux system membrane fusion protein